MSGDKRNALERVFGMALLFLGIVIVLDLAIGYLRAILPWLAGGAAIAGTAWLGIAIVRWRRSKW